MRWRWALPVLLLLLTLATGAYPLVATARDDVAFCLSCHVMDGQGKSYANSFHKHEATCSDCHTATLAQKYQDGARHLWANLSGVDAETIALHEAGRAVVALNCATCHNPTSLHSRTKQSKQQNCLECHRGHHPNPYPALPGTE